MLIFNNALKVHKVRTYYGSTEEDIQDKIWSNIKPRGGVVCCDDISQTFNKDMPTIPRHTRYLYVIEYFEQHEEDNNNIWVANVYKSYNCRHPYIKKTKFKR